MRYGDSPKTTCFIVSYLILDFSAVSSGKKGEQSSIMDDITSLADEDLSLAFDTPDQVVKVVFTILVSVLQCLLASVYRDRLHMLSRNRMGFVMHLSFHLHPCP